MIRPKAQLPQHPLAQQILAWALAWLALTAGVPANTLSSPLPTVSHVRFASPAAAAIPRSEALPEPPSAAAAASDDADEEAKKWGEITVGQPKIWQYERVNSLLDGLLRDVQGVSMSDLIGLDSNATNGAAVKFVQSMLEIGVQYNQGAATTNAITLQNYSASQGIASAQIQANGAYLQQLYSERTSVTGQLQAAMQLNTTLQGQLAATDPTVLAYKSLTTQQQAAASQVTSLQSDLSSINTQITSASSTTMPAAPTLTPTTGGTAPETANTFSSFLGNLPPDLTKNIVSQLQSPSLPATKRLDNFITLLYERLAREISVLQDDVMRDTENIPFLVQFDVGLYPGIRAKDHVGVVEFTMDCEGCKVYSIYPGQSSYNLATYNGASKRYSFWGSLATLIGLGVTADYRRQTDTLRGDLVQSVYMSGFQEGAESFDRTDKPKTQRFGWYYGSAPFEPLVTPGIRSTFAIVSVPRRIISDCKDPEKYCPTGLSREFVDDEKRIVNVGLNIKANVDWMRRDDPFYQQKDSLPNSLPSSLRTGMSWFTGTSLNLKKSSKFISKYLKVVLPGTDGINDIPRVVLAERNRLHVLGMEYNPVYYALPPQTTTATTTTPTPPLPGTASATATGAGTGTTTVMVSGAGTASASSSGTSSTTATATAANPSTTPSPTPSTPSAPDPLTGCKQGQCAAVLVKLAEPLDPNIVVTVRGLPLRRVRDWRGRATSVLPPAQSASDLMSPATLSTPGSTAAPGKPLGAENAPSASLFEVDSPGPDTWMEVDSHRILLNISRTLAGDRNDFPTIQIIDPAKTALFLPLELDTGFSNLIMNGFHFPTRNGKQLEQYLDNHFTGGLSNPGNTDIGLRPAGPYAYETFLPLFLPRRDPQPIYAYLGETGVQILIGLEKIKPDPSKTGPPPKAKTWLAGKTQVVLEDRYLDLAWSLSCYPQSPMLVCDVPMQEIRDAYHIVQKICFPNRADPSKPPACPSMPSTLDGSLSISTLQVWVDQYDPDNDDSFYSSVPAAIGRFPLVQPNDTTNKRADVGYRPWYFESADPNWVKLTGCNYPEFPAREDNKSQLVTILGRGIPQPYRTQVLQTGVEAGCKWFVIPTLALTNQEVVIEYPSADHYPTEFIPFTDAPVTAKTTAPCTNHAATFVCTPESLSAALFQPSFDTPIAIPHRNPSTGDDKTPPIARWTIDIPVRHVDCNDALDILTEATGLSAYWMVGTVPPLKVRTLNDPLAIPCKNKIHDSIFALANAAAAKAKSDEETANTDEAKAGNDAAAKAKALKEKAKTVQEATDARSLRTKAEAAEVIAPDWDNATKNGQLMLELEIKRTDLGNLPLKNPAKVLRGPFLSRIATLPDLRPSFLPTILSVVNIGTNQFALEGDNAGAIDAVTVLGPSTFDNPIPVASGAQIALVTLPPEKSKPAVPSKPAIANLMPETGKGNSGVTITGTNFGPTPGKIFFDKAELHPGPNCWSDTSITVNVPKDAKPGNIDVSVENSAGTSNAISFTVEASPLGNPKQTSCLAPKTNPPAGPKAGTYTVLPLIALTRDATTGKILQYMPLDVLDPNGKPLIFTAAEPKSDGTTTPKGVESPTTTLTISKKTTVTPAPAATTGGGTQ